MEKRCYGIVLLLLLLLTHELVVHTEARRCYSKSRTYHGRCFFKNQRTNCKAICKQEKFTTGQCIRGTCYCMTKCGSPPAPHKPPAPPTPPPEDTPTPPEDTPTPPEGGGDMPAPPDQGNAGEFLMDESPILEFE